MLKNKENPVFIGSQSMFNCKTGIEKMKALLLAGGTGSRLFPGDFRRF
jgi:hypothetical protein